MIPTVVGGVISLIVALAFLGVLVVKIPSIALWIVVLTGVVSMVVSLVEEIRSDRETGGL